MTEGGEIALHEVFSGVLVRESRVGWRGGNHGSGFKLGGGQCNGLGPLCVGVEVDLYGDRLVGVMELILRQRDGSMTSQYAERDYDVMCLEVAGRAAVVT